jgi:hypothetical protein
MGPMSDVVMLPCYEGSVWLILDMISCLLGTVAGQSVADFSQSQ